MKPSDAQVLRFESVDGPAACAVAEIVLIMATAPNSHPAAKSVVHTVRSVTFSREPVADLIQRWERALDKGRE